MELNLVEELLKITLIGSEWVLWLLLLLSVASLAVVVERLVWFARNTRGADTAHGEVARHLLQGDDAGAVARVEGARSVEARVVARALRWQGAGADAFNDALQSELAQERLQLERGLNFLGTLGNNAPFIGLFGTCIGVIQAFQHLSADASGAGGAMDQVMHGIAEALIATAVGIFVAIPAVVAYNMIQKRIGDVESRVQALGGLFAAWLRRSTPDAVPGVRAGKE